MATSNQIVEMLRSHFEGDEERFRTAALQLAANEARIGHESVANEIQKLVEKTKRPVLEPHLSSQASNASQTHNPLVGLLEAVEPKFGLQHMVLADEMRIRLNRILKEYHNFNRLHEYDLRPRQKILLLGPPGCGKTMTAYALAHDLKMPLYVVRLDSLFTKYLGETAAKLRTVFDAIHSQRAVFLFDEFDSLGLSRGSQNDIAEIRRVLNSFLVFMDNIKGTSLIIAASNHPEYLDSALFRRFDDVIEYSMPTPEEAMQLIKRRIMDQPHKEINWRKVQNATESMSFAEIVRVADGAVKERIIENLPKMTTELILKIALERKKYSQQKK